MEPIAVQRTTPRSLERAHRADRAPLLDVIPSLDAHAAADGEEHRAGALAPQHHQPPAPGWEGLVQWPARHIVITLLVTSVQDRKHRGWQAGKKDWSSCLHGLHQD